MTFKVRNVALINNLKLSKIKLVLYDFPAKPLEQKKKELMCSTLVQEANQSEKR